MPEFPFNHLRILGVEKMKPYVPPSHGDIECYSRFRDYPDGVRVTLTWDPNHVRVRGEVTRNGTLVFCDVYTKSQKIGVPSEASLNRFADDVLQQYRESRNVWARMLEDLEE